MNEIKKFMFNGFISLALTGCLHFVSTDLAPGKSYGEYWVKPGMTKEKRSQDSIDCGGSTRGPDFTSQQTNTARQPEDKNDVAADTRLTKAWIKCMKEKGYRYTR